MLALAVVATLLNLRSRGAWFEGGQGFPLRWHKWTDFVQDGASPSTYHMPALLLDLGIAFVVIISVGLGIERLIDRFSDKEV